MEELAKLEGERGTAGHTLDGTVKNSGAETTGMHDRDTVSKGKGKQERVASNEMCTFLILNISSLQLIPVNMIAYRSQYGSVKPAGIIAPGLWRRLLVC